MIPKEAVRATIVQELNHVLKDHFSAQQAVMQSHFLNLATDYIHESVNKFNDSWSILAKCWNDEVIKKGLDRKLMPTDTMPKEMAGDYVAKLAFVYANKRFEQLGLNIRLKPTLSK